VTIVLSASLAGQHVKPKSTHRICRARHDMTVLVVGEDRVSEGRRSTIHGDFFALRDAARETLVCNCSLEKRPQSTRRLYREVGAG